MSHTQPGCLLDVDRSFGPWVGDACRGGFDFTLLFEETILTIPLQCIFLIVAPLRIWQLMRTEKKVIPSTHLTLKLTLSICIIALSASLLGLWVSGSSSIETKATSVTAILVLLSSLPFCLLTWLEHDRNIKPSFILFAYLFLSIILDLPRCRTLWMSETSSTIPAIFATSLALRLALVLVESADKRSALIEKYLRYSRETTASTLSRSVFWWLGPLFRGGYKQNLSLDDLYPLDPKLESEPLYRVYQEAWEMVPEKTVDGILYMTWLKVFSGPVMTAFVPKLFVIAFTYAQPFLIEEGIKLAASPPGQPGDNMGYGLIGAYVIVYIGIAISTGQYEWRAARAASVMRGAVIGLIYQKALRLDVTAPDVSPEGALTLASTDVETAMQGVIYYHDVWGAFLEMGIGTYLLYRQLGPACAMPLAIVLVVLVASAFVAVPIGKAQAAWIQASQDRVTTTSKTLASIKPLKISGLSTLAFSAVRDLRATELRVSEKFRKLLAATLILMICIPVWSPILTFCVFAGQAGNVLDFQKAFTSYALLALVNRPLTEVVLALPVIASSVTSFGRIQKFLNGRERRDNRMTGRDEDEKSGREPLEEGIIASVQGKFARKDGAEPLLDIQAWSIKARTFTLLLGPVGCGKSTLLQALLGELSDFDGTIRTNYSRVGYCSQSAWLPNDTIRNIIIGGAVFDEPWYARVLEACALGPDIQEWPKGDETVVGTMGITMSGGQRHRLSLARAVYSRPDFMIIDDSFSGLDSATEDSIFRNLLGGDGMLRLAGITVVVASSDGRRAPYADQVMLLDDKGHITEADNPEHLGTRVWSHGSGLSHAEHADHEAAATEQTQQRSQTALAGQAMVADMEYQAQTARRLGDSALYGFYAGAVGWTSLALFVVSMGIFAFCSSFPNIWLKWWAEANLEAPGADLGKWLGVYVALGVGSVLTVCYGAWQLFINIINNSGVYFHDLLVDTTSRAKLSFHAAVDSGVTVNRFSQDLQLIDMELPGTALGLAVSVAFGIAEFIMIAVASRYIAAILPFLLLSFYLIQHFYLRTSRQIRLLDIELKAPLYTQLITTLDGLVTIRAFGWQGDFERRNLALLDDSQRPSYLLYCIQRWLTLVVDMMIAAIALVLIVVTTTLREQIGPGYMGIALSNILSFSGTVKAALTSWVMLEIAISAVARIRAFSQTTELEGGSVKDQEEPDDKEWPAQGGIELRGVSASYPSSGRVLHEVDLSIKPGEKVAICGRSGSGKSSLVLCILRLMDMDAGSVSIDGVDLATVPHDYVRTRLNCVPQDAYVFGGTARAAIDPEGVASDEQIQQALEKVRLWGKVEQRGGLGADLDDKSFSQGETQLLVFARAMLQKSKVLILDEFTSSLDEEASRIVYDVLNTWFGGCTVLAIAHKLEPVLGFDKVVVMSSGRMVEVDEPKTLLAREDSVFKELFESKPDSA